MVSARREPAARRGQLSRRAIIEAGLEIVRADGLGSLTMRRLADRLGVEAMSLYNHVRDKADLLDGIASLVLGGIAQPDGAAPWPQRLRTLFYSLYGILTAEPWLVVALTAEKVEPSGSEAVLAMDVVVATLEEAGLAPAQRVSAFRGMLALCIGLATTHTLGLRASPKDALAHFGQWSPDKWRATEVPHLTALAPQFLLTRPADDAHFMLEAFLDALGAPSG